MLIGAHVSPAGGLPGAIEQGLERDCRAIQIFNQSPRMWRPTVFPPDDVEAFRAAMADSQIDAVLIHAVYLLNCASDDPEIREKSLASLTHSLRVGHDIGAHGVVLHPGSAKASDPAEAVARAGATIEEALAESESCPLHLENTAGAGGTLGRSIDELASLLDAAGGDERLGLCLDSCHLLASGYDIRTHAGMDALTQEIEAKIGVERVGSLHLNDSQTRSGQTGTGTRTSVGASSARAGARRSWRPRPCRICRACSRRPARTARARRERRSSSRSACTSGAYASAQRPPDGKYGPQRDFISPRVPAKGGQGQLNQRP